MSDFQTSLCHRGNRYSSLEAAAQCRPAKEAATGKPHEIVGRKGRGCVPESSGEKRCSDAYYFSLRPIQGCFFEKEKFRIGYPTMNYREQAKQCVSELNRMAHQLSKNYTFTMACTDFDVPERQRGCWIYRNEEKTPSSGSKKK